MDDYINLKFLNFDELVGVVKLYPWFGVARKELCVRMMKAGGDSWGMSQYADAAMYIVSREMISEMFRNVKKQDCIDADLRKPIEQEEVPVAEDSNNASKSEMQAHDTETSTTNAVSLKEMFRGVAGTDYFTSEEYQEASRETDNVFTDFVAETTVEKPYNVTTSKETAVKDFCTETLARVYAEQGYFEEAKRIYSKLILVNPEKNTYFASLIEKLDKEINN